jgi:hypothetical protein
MPTITLTEAALDRLKRNMAEPRVLVDAEFLQSAHDGFSRNGGERRECGP